MSEIEDFCLILLCHGEPANFGTGVMRSQVVLGIIKNFRQKIHSEVEPEGNESLDKNDGQSECIQTVTTNLEAPL